MKRLADPPDPSEYPPYYGRYIELVEHSDILSTLTQQAEESEQYLRTVSDAASLFRPAPGTWSMREVLGHLIDTERIFAYRALRFARQDPSPLASYEPDPYVPAARFDEVPWPELIEEFIAVRRSHVLLFKHFPAEAWDRTGIASGNEISVRALVWIIAGHELHHRRLIREALS